MLGVGTIFQLKPRADDHWSSSPKVNINVEAEADAAGEPPIGDLPLNTRPLRRHGRPVRGRGRRGWFRPTDGARAKHPKGAPK